MDLKPIDTKYNGYNFRSRLEARWAVFLDKMGISYLYEPEGFELDTTRYLPDFQLTEGLKCFGENMPLANVWMEIKPTRDLNENERQKIAQFVKQSENKVILVAGDPHPETVVRLISFGSNNKWSSEEIKWLEFNDGQPGILPLNKLNRISDPDTRNAITKLSEAPALIAAYRAAREARFERGTTPASPPVTKKQCQSCGKTFIPIQPHYYLCQDCYRQSRVTPAPASRPAQLPHPLPPPGQPESHPSYRWAIILFGITILIMCSIAAAFLLSQSPDEQIPTALPTAITLPTEEPTATPSPTVTPEPVCDCTTNTYDCSDFSTQAQAQACFNTCFPTKGDIHLLDSNSDGQACESLP
jgi:hypothetical protein